MQATVRTSTAAAARRPAVGVPAPRLQQHAARPRAVRVQVRATPQVVADVMTSGHDGEIYTCSPEDTVDSALEKLVRFRITGLPVVNERGAVVGVVSDADLLALHSLGRTKDDRALFPAADQTWQAFTDVKRLLAKTGGNKIRDVMTANPVTVSPQTDLDEAARLLLSKRVHRLPVVEGGKLVGVISRGNLVKAALAMRTAAQSN